MIDFVIFNIVYALGILAAGVSVVVLARSGRIQLGSKSTGAESP